MKIIGQTNHGFILEAKATEVANLAGYYYEGECREIMKVGKTIEVHGMYRALYEIHSRRKDLAKVAETLRGIAGLLELQAPIIDQLAEEAEGAS